MKLKINRPASSNINNELINQKITQNVSIEKNDNLKNNILPSLNKKSDDNAIVNHPNFSVIKQEKIIPRIYSSNQRRNRDNLFRNDNTINNPYNSNNNNLISGILGNNENYLSPLNIIPINLTKNNKKQIFDNCIKLNDNSIIEKDNRIDIINRKYQIYIPKICVNHVKKLSSNINSMGIKDWKI